MFHMVLNTGLSMELSFAPRMTTMHRSRPHHDTDGVGIRQKAHKQLVETTDPYSYSKYHDDVLGGFVGGLMTPMFSTLNESHI